MRVRSYLEEFREAWAVVERGPEDLHLYQKVGVEFLERTPYCALFVDMGLGKTIMVLTMISNQIAASPDMQPDGKVLIVAPKRVANTTWPQEIPLWAHTMGIRYSVVTGTEQQKTTALTVPADLYITNRESVSWLVEKYEERWPFRQVIVDESSSLKSHNSKRFDSLRKVRPLIKRLVELTATPISEGYEGLFAQIFLLDRGQALGHNITAYRNRYMTFNAYSRQYKLRPGAETEITEKIAPLTLTLKAEEYLPRDAPTVKDRHFSLSKKAFSYYEEMQENSLIQVGETEIEAKTAAQVSSKLLQIASGAVYNTVIDYDEENDGVIRNRTTHEVHGEKVETLVQLLNEVKGEPVLICYHFESSLKKILAALPKAQVMDKDGKLVKKWNSGKIGHLLIHPASAGHGLNMQKGGRRMVFFDIPYSLDNYLQVIGRIDRQGQDKVVFLHHLIADGTLDAYVVKRLKEKRSVQDDMFRRLRVLHARYKEKLSRAVG